MKKRINDMEPGTRFRTSGSTNVLLKLRGAVAQQSGTFQAVDINTGSVACPCGSGCSPQLARIEYEIVKEPTV